MSGELLHPPEDIVQQLLVDLGVGVLPTTAGDWKIYSDDFPGGLDAIVGVFGTAGLSQGRDHISGTQFEKYGIQVRVRAENVVDCYQKIKQIFDRLTKQVLRREVEVETVLYKVQSVTAAGTIFSMGKTSVDRNRQYVANFIASIKMIEEETGTGS